MADQTDTRWDRRILRGLLCLTLAVLTALLWFTGMNLVQEDLNLRRADHPGFTTPAPRERTP